MATKQLTERQRRVYELIRELILNRGYGPTVREIGEAFGIKSPNGVMCHLRAFGAEGPDSPKPKQIASDRIDRRASNAGSTVCRWRGWSPRARQRWRLSKV